jgi:hypothetical protein
MNKQLKKIGCKNSGSPGVNSSVFQEERRGRKTSRSSPSILQGFSGILNQDGGAQGICSNKFLRSIKTLPRREIIFIQDKLEKLFFVKNSEGGYG